MLRTLLLENFVYVFYIFTLRDVQRYAWWPSRSDLGQGRTFVLIILPDSWWLLILLIFSHRSTCVDLLTSTHISNNID